MIRPMTALDAPRVLEIYGLGLATRMATFETQVPDWASWDANHLPHARLVYVQDPLVLGWAALAAVSRRAVYRGVAELSVYVDPHFQQQGIGSRLMENIIASSEQQGIWTLHSSIFPENLATLKLHEKYGFRLIGRREKIARLDGCWRDTLLLERRSKKTALN